MYDLSKIHQVIYYIKSVSNNRLVDKGSHFETFCPYCGDMTRKHNPSHGHLYISKTLPICHCFRCSMSPTILTLLIDLGFDDYETLNYIKTFMKFNFVKDYISTKPKVKYNQKLLIENIIQQINRISSENLSIFNDYLNSRIGCVNYSKFLLYPTFINPNQNIQQKVLTVGFNNSDNNFVGARLIKPIGKIRYKTNPNSWYYFQEFNFDKIENIVLTEGIFDVLNVYLYTNYFTYKNTFFMSMSGKNYLSVLEKLIIQDLLIGDFHIHFILDTDNKYINFLKYKAKLMSNLFNPNIVISIWKPIQGLKDLGEFPLMEKVV